MPNLPLLVFLPLALVAALYVLHQYLYTATHSFSAFAMDEEIITLRNTFVARPPIANKLPVYSMFPDDDYSTDDFALVDDAYCTAGEEEIMRDILGTNPAAFIKTTPEPANTKSPAEIAANAKLAEVLRVLGTGRGPFIVGGIGDSGTRGVHALLEALGIYMLHQGEVIAVSKDSKPFMKSRAVIDEDGSVVEAVQAFDLYMDPIRASGTLNYNLTAPHTLSSPNRHRVLMARQWIADVMLDTLAFFKRYRLKRDMRGGAQAHAFGFKHPRTALILPYLLDALGSKFTFIHVLRDGREVAKGHNIHVFQDICYAYYGSERKCRTRRVVDMWADMNRDIFQFAKANLRAHQYYAIRVEDLVMDRMHCYEHFAAFLGLYRGRNATARVGEQLHSVMHELMMPHVSSYFANKYTVAERNEMTMLQNISPSARQALRFWGYDPRTMQDTKTDCTRMPWLKMLRKAKGYVVNRNETRTM